MKNARKEIIFLFSVAIISLSFSIIVGFDYIHPQQARISWKDLKKANVTDIRKDFKESNDSMIRFHNGIPYEFTMDSPEDVSSFYNENINMIPSSTYWRHPLNENKTQLVITKNNSVEFSAEKMNGLPIVSLIIEPDDFFSYENGIYVPGHESDFISSSVHFPFPWHKPANYYRNENDKRKTHFSFYDESGKIKYSSIAMVEINGKATRCFPQKSLRLTAIKEKGSKKFSHDFFKDGNFYSTILLRNGGNDNTKALIRDRLMQKLVDGSGLLVSGFVPCEVFLNGEYWGIHYVQNKLNENFIANKMGVKEKKVVLVESWNLESGEEVEFNSLIRQVKDIRNFDYKMISELFDMNEFARYIAAEMFFVNTDWPANNIQLYKITGSKQQDTKWKFALFDMDYGFGYTGADAYETDMFAYLFGKNDLFSTLFKRMMKEDSFRKLLKEQMEFMIDNYFSEKRMLTEIGQLKTEIEQAIPDHTAKWRKPASFDEWEHELIRLQEFAEKRGEVMKKQIKKNLE
jgi:hypothetical protein